MKKRHLFFILFAPLALTASSYSLVFIHIGKALPSYLPIAIDQARLFNPDCEIVLLASQEAIENSLLPTDVTSLPFESLEKTKEHIAFIEQGRLSEKIQDGYWRYTTERFFYLYDYMVAFDKKDVFHLENDVLLFANLEGFLPLFHKHYKGIATTFESEKKGVAALIYFSSPYFANALVTHLVHTAQLGFTDMKSLSLFWQKRPDIIDCLPMIMEKYLADHTPKTFQNNLLERKRRHAKHIEEFNSLFDGAAIGVFFDGLRDATGQQQIGFLTKGLFNPSHLTYTWEFDEKDRKVPSATYDDKTYRINTLHIASKRLFLFTSKN